MVTRCTRAALLLLLLGAAPALADDVSGRPPFLWRAQGACNSVYLLGSVHFAHRDMYPLDPIIERMFARSPNLVVELDLEREAASVIALTMREGFYQGGQSLKQALSAELYVQVRDYAATLGMPAVSVTQMKPWLLALSLSVLQAAAAGFEPDAGIDRYFLDRAGGKRIVALEDAELQIGLFSRLPDAMQVRFLKETVNVAVDQQAVGQLLDTWRDGDAEALRALLHASLDHPDGAELYRRVFVDRNRDMAAAILQLLQESEDYFVVVGVGHFVGPLNILELLEEGGVAAERVVGGEPSRATD